MAKVGPMKKVWLMCLCACILAFPAALVAKTEGLVTGAALAGALAAALALNTRAPDEQDEDGYHQGEAASIMNVIQGDPELTIFRTCVEDVADRVKEYGDRACAALLVLEEDDADDSFKGTVFAPTDRAMASDAFQEIARQLRKGDRECQDAWLSLILSHICPDAYSPDDLAVAKEIPSMGGGTILIDRLRDSTPERHKGTGESRTKVCPWHHRKVKNGFVYKLDHILLPGKFTKTEEEMA